MADGTPVIVRAEEVPGADLYAGWDADGTRYVIKSWGGFLPLYVYTDGSYGTNLGEISTRDLLRALGVDGC